MTPTGLSSRNFQFIWLQTSWLTPSELFQPWYGEAVARYVVRHHVRQQTKSPLRIVELGGGRGTFARNFLVCVCYLLRAGIQSSTDVHPIDVLALFKACFRSSSGFFQSTGKKALVISDCINGSL
jgi:hypothetical protein